MPYPHIYWKMGVGGFMSPEEWIHHLGGGDGGLLGCAARSAPCRLGGRHPPSTNSSLPPFKSWGILDLVTHQFVAFIVFECRKSIHDDFG